MPPDGRRVAVVEDDPVMGASLEQRLRLEGYDVAWARSGEEALPRLCRGDADVVVCDVRLPDMSGEDLYRRAAGGAVAAPFLFITAFGDIDQAVRLVRAGAADYLTKPFEMADFLDRLRLLATRHAVAILAEGRLGVSPEMAAVEAMLTRLAGLPTTVLITGETGVGKEVCARFLHEAMGRAGRPGEAPFMAVNCAAIPAELLESELFGHERGAFTGAAARHRGYAERAADGILFLDEIGALPVGLQAKLLRLIEERAFHRLGGEARLPFRARLVCATNADLDAAVAAGRFREDLLYRINVVQVVVPPLRRRRDDIPWLLDRVFDELVQTLGRDLAGMSSLVEEAALAHPWPGNVRELRNRMERAVALAVGERLQPGDLFPDQPGGVAVPAGLAPLAAVREAAERRQILRALAETDGQVARAASLLGVARTTLWEKMRRYGIHGAD